MIHVDPLTGNANEGVTAPEGYTLSFTSPAQYEAWKTANGFGVVVDIPVVYTRQDYKNALDRMLQAQCARYEFDGIQTLAIYLFDSANKFHARALWLARLNVFTWQTSDDMAAPPPTGEPPTPEQFAGYILSMFEQVNPRP